MKEQEIDFEQELYNHFGQIKDFTLGMRIGKHFYELGCRRTAEKYDEIEYNRQRAEESVPNDLEEAADEYLQKVKAGFLRTLEHPTAKDCFKDGAKWQVEQDKETIELAEDHAFLAGAEWQKEQDLAEMAQSKSPLSVAYANRCFENGKQAMKEQMMKEAVEGVVTYDNFGNNVVRAGEFNKDFEYGDKVRVIICKKEDWLWKKIGLNAK